MQLLMSGAESQREEGHLQAVTAADEARLNGEMCLCWRFLANVGGILPLFFFSKAELNVAVSTEDTKFNLNKSDTCKPQPNKQIALLGNGSLYGAAGLEVLPTVPDNQPAWFLPQIDQRAASQSRITKQFFFFF